MTTHSAGSRRYKYGHRHAKKDAGTLHVPTLQYRDGACQLCGHCEKCVMTEATKGKYLCSACRYLIVDGEVNKRLSRQATLSEANAEWAAWKRRKQ